MFVVIAMTTFAISVGSPNQRIKLVFDIDLKDSVPTYQVFFDEKEVIAKSEMGFLLDGDKDLKYGFSLNNVDIKDSNYSITLASSNICFDKFLPIP